MAVRGLNFYYYDGLQQEMRAGIINEHECIWSFDVLPIHFFSIFEICSAGQRELSSLCAGSLQMSYKYCVLNYGIMDLR